MEKTSGSTNIMKVEFNIIGTVLVSCGNDSIMKVWKTDYNKHWTCVSKIQDLDNNGEMDEEL